ncbi:UDP-glycosyltransferase 87A2 [Bienertia sinuspersici]
METSPNKPPNHRHVVAMPYPGRGHINPMLNLCKLILSKSNSIAITFVVTEEWLGLLGSEAQAPPPNLNFASLPQVIPSEIGRAADFPGFIEAVFTKMPDPFERLIDRLEPPPTALICDCILAWVVGVGNQRNIPVASLVTFPASYLSVLSNLDLLVQHGHFPIDVSDYIPGLPPTTIADLPTIFHGDGEKVLPRVLESISSISNAQHLLLTSLYEFEGQVITCLKTKFPTPIYHIGPMIPYLNLTNNTTQIRSKYYFEWLDSQSRGSVLYISQGSFLSVSSDQVQEIIAGIKESNVRFLWVTRDDTSRFEVGDDSDNRGLLVPWCDQLRVLCHPSVGGFWTHCGWNSTMEGVYAGVPMLTCPISLDQFSNSKLIVNDLKIGWRVMKNNHIKMERHEIAQLVRKFMDSECNERKEMIGRAKELQHIFNKAIEDGGSAASHLDAFINNINGQHSVSIKELTGAQNYRE